MRLLVKRDTTTKGGMFGSKQLFQLTLKVELTPEEAAIVKRHGLEDAFDVENPDSKRNFSYQDFVNGKTISDTAVSSLLADLHLCQTVLEVANSKIKDHGLFPGESVIEIA